MPPKQRKIIEILMQCRRCGWLGPVIKCDCNSDYEKDDARLRCPKCMANVKQIGEE